MPTDQTVLLVGGTGRTGRRVLAQLVSRGVGVRAIVRSSRGAPAGAAGSPGVEVVEASLLSLSGDELRHHLRGCSAVISCLGGAHARRRRRDRRDGTGQAGGDFPGDAHQRQALSTAGGGLESLRR